jgi:hypothetical protein
LAIEPPNAMPFLGEADTLAPMGRLSLPNPKGHISDQRLT